MFRGPEGSDSGGPDHTDHTGSLISRARTSPAGLPAKHPLITCCCRGVFAHVALQPATCARPRPRWACVVGSQKKRQPNGASSQFLGPPGSLLGTDPRQDEILGGYRQPATRRRRVSRIPRSSEDVTRSGLGGCRAGEGRLLQGGSTRSPPPPSSCIHLATPHSGGAHSGQQWARTQTKAWNFQHRLSPFSVWQQWQALTGPPYSSTTPAEPRQEGPSPCQ